MTDHFDDHDGVDRFDDDHDLDALRAMRSDVAPPSEDVLAAARHRLIDQDVRPAVLIPRHRRTRRPVRRRVLVGLGATAAVAAVAAGSFALTAPGDRRTPQAAPTTRGGGTSSGAPSSDAPVHFVSAAQLLDAAAANADRTPVPAAGQYLHVRNHNYSIASIDEPPGDGAYELTENRSDTWTPATTGTSYQRNDNNIDVDYPTAEQRAYARSSPGGIPKRELTWYENAPDGTSTQVYPQRVQGPEVSSCTDCDSTVWDDPEADTASLPRDPGKLRASLYAWAKKNYRDLVKYGKGDQFTVDDLAYDGATNVVTRPDLPGDLRAELYRVIKTIPDIKLIGALANYDGVTGVAVGRVDTFHVQHDLIFTDNGSTYIGDRTVVRKPSVEYEVKAETLIGASAVTVTVTGKPDVPRPRR